MSLYWKLSKVLHFGQNAIVETLMDSDIIISYTSFFDGEKMMGSLKI